MATIYYELYDEFGKVITAGRVSAYKIDQASGRVHMSGVHDPVFTNLSNNTYHPTVAKATPPMYGPDLQTEFDFGGIVPEIEADEKANGCQCPISDLLSVGHHPSCPERKP